MSFVPLPPTSLPRRVLMSLETAFMVLIGSYAAGLYSVTQRKCDSGGQLAMVAIGVLGHPSLPLT
ncbi:hypothetical protein D9611_006239 [Ephemerocybe angulata]|uniref:Uncharacterized protein n=1 Tax=Ephemerocybe angulata TaxID=980116 RepID=A0A8H5FG67_9AGAR|nr:hypothetical protein D9611_006239 [Tulosesus angulatus]